MAKWEPEVVTFKAHPVTANVSKLMLEDLVELFYKLLASSKDQTASIGKPELTVAGKDTCNDIRRAS